MSAVSQLFASRIRAVDAVGQFRRAKPFSRRKVAGARGISRAPTFLRVANFFARRQPMCASHQPPGIQLAER